MDERLNTQQLIDRLCAKSGVSRAEAEAFVAAFFGVVEEGLESDRYVKVRGLGTFKLIDVDSRESINVRTGERFEIQGHSKVSFSADSSLKETVNKPFSHFETVVLGDDVNFPATEEATSEGEDEPLATPTEEAQEPIAEPTPTAVVQTPADLPPEPEQPAEVTLTPSEPAEATLPEPEEEETKPTDEVGEEPSSVPEPDEEVRTETPGEMAVENLSVAHSQQNSSSYRGLIIVAVVLIVLCLTVVAYLYGPDILSSLREQKLPKVQTEQVDTPAPEAEPTVSDTLSSEPVEPTPTKAEVAPVAPATQAKPLVVPDSTSRVITGTLTTHTVKEGETLTRIALRYYGTKDLWPYIVKHNADKLKNPNDVIVGTVLLIPELKEK